MKLVSISVSKLFVYHNSHRLIQHYFLSVQYYEVLLSQHILADLSRNDSLINISTDSKLFW